MGNALQSNEAWFQARRGKFTGSNFKLLVNKGRGKDFTEQGYSYIRKVVAERMGSYDFPSRSKACDWGNEHEAEAIEVYEENTGYVTDETGFVLHAEHDFAGCSVMVRLLTRVELSRLRILIILLTTSDTQLMRLISLKSMEAKSTATCG